MCSCSNFIIRITRVVANQIYANRMCYVGIERDWSEGSNKIFLIKYSPDQIVTSSNELSDVFIGFGIIEKALEPSHLNFVEKTIWVQNNYSKKIFFGKLVRFVHEVPLKGSLGRWMENTGPTLHGTQISNSEISKIENRAAVILIT
jgi:hypothetical protein